MNTTFEQITFISDQPSYINGPTSTIARLRERQQADKDLTTFSDYEILQLLISYTGGEKSGELAERLLDTFGSLKGVLETRPEQLQMVKGIGTRTASLISMMIPMVRTWSRLCQEVPDRIGNSREAENYCKSLLAGERLENFYVIALNAKCNVLGARKIATGSLSEVSAYPRLVMETALNYNAHSILLSHNHPGGTCAPSPEDISSTIQLQRLLSGVGILVLDHIIVAGDRTYSMIQHGDIDYRTKGR